MAKYVSRRKRKKKGGAVNIAKAIPKAMKGLAKGADAVANTLAKNVSDSANTLLKIKKAKDAIPQEPQIRKHIARAARAARFTIRHPDLSVDLEGLAKAIHAKHIVTHLPRRGGALEESSIKRLVDTAVNMANPINELKKGKAEYDQIRFSKDPNQWARQGAKGLLHAYAGNAHMASAHQKGASLFVPESAAIMAPMSEGFSKFGDGIGWVARRI